MQVEAASGAARQTAATPASRNALNYDAFLRLLVAQMQNQDPTAPMDSTQYLSQLASFAAVEQGVATNGKLDGLMTAMELSQADSVIGRHVTNADGTVSGIVKSLEIADGGAIAVLDSGERLALGSGVSIAGR
jgi:flagellar basal-body rod modification protein FlgD